MAKGKNRVAEASIALRLDDSTLSRELDTKLGNRLKRKLTMIEKRMKIPLRADTRFLAKDIKDRLAKLKSSRNAIKIPVRADTRVLKSDLKKTLAEMKSKASSLKVPLRADARFLRKDIREAVEIAKSKTRSIKVPLRADVRFLRKDITSAVDAWKGKSKGIKVPLRIDHRFLKKDIRFALWEIRNEQKRTGGGKGVKVPIRADGRLLKKDLREIIREIRTDKRYTIRLPVTIDDRSLSRSMASAIRKVNSGIGGNMRGGRMGGFAGGGAMRPMGGGGMMSGMMGANVRNPLGGVGRTGMGVVGGVMGGLTGGMGMGMGAGLGAAGLGMAGGLATAGTIKHTADFEQALQNAFAIMHTTTEQEKRMAAEARKLAIEFGKSAVSMAEGYEQLASANMTAEQAMAALPAVTRFATAGNMEMAESTELLLTSLGALKLASDDPAKNLANLTYLTDRLAKANDIGQGSVQDFAMALETKSAGVFREAGKSVEELLATLTAMANQGIKSRRAGEEVSIMLIGLREAAIRNAPAFRKLGIEVFDPMTGKMKHMADMIGAFEKRLGGASDAQRTFALEAMGIENAAAKVLAQMIGTSGKIREYETSLHAADGATQHLAEKRMDTFWGSVKRLGAAIGELALTAGPPLVDWLRDVVDGTKDSVLEFSEWVDGLDITKEKISGFIAEAKSMFSGWYDSLVFIFDNWDIIWRLAVVEAKDSLITVAEKAYWMGSEIDAAIFGAVMAGLSIFDDLVAGAGKRFDMIATMSKGLLKGVWAEFKNGFVGQKFKVVNGKIEQVKGTEFGAKFKQAMGGEIAKRPDLLEPDKPVGSDAAREFNIGQKFARDNFKKAGDEAFGGLRKETNKERDALLQRQADREQSKIDTANAEKEAAKDPWMQPDAVKSWKRGIKEFEDMTAEESQAWWNEHVRGLKPGDKAKDKDDPLSLGGMPVAQEERRSEFVGIEDMNRRIQESLTKENKDQKNLKVLEMIAKFAEKTTKAAEKTAENTDADKNKKPVPVFAPD